MAASTSLSVAMLVSPGVVMASAPWAAPYSTASCGVLPARKPYDQARGEAVAAADAVVDLQVLAQRRLVELAASRTEIAPQSFSVAVLALRSVVATAWKLGYILMHLGDHLLEVRRIELGDVLVHLRAPRSRAPR